MIKVKAFVDHSNLTITWAERYKDHDFPWGRLPGFLSERVKRALAGFSPDPIDFRGINVYASVDPDDPTAEATERRFRDDLDSRTGYTVKVYRQLALQTECPQGHEGSKRGERGVDTKIACDVLALGIKGAYDIAVLITSDSDLIPAVESVQDILDRRVIHLGFGGDGKEIRAACWGHLLVSDLYQGAPVQNPRPSLAGKPKRGKWPPKVKARQ